MTLAPSIRGHILDSIPQIWWILKVKLWRLIFYNSSFDCNEICIKVLILICYCSHRKKNRTQGYVWWAHRINGLKDKCDCITDIFQRTLSNQCFLEISDKVVSLSAIWESLQSAWLLQSHSNMTNTFLSYLLQYKEK